MIPQGVVCLCVQTSFCWCAAQMFGVTLDPTLGLLLLQAHVDFNKLPDVNKNLFLTAPVSHMYQTQGPQAKYGLPPLEGGEQDSK